MHTWDRWNYWRKIVSHLHRFHPSVSVSSHLSKKSLQDRLFMFRLHSPIVIQLHNADSHCWYLLQDLKEISILGFVLLDSTTSTINNMKLKDIMKKHLPLIHLIETVIMLISQCSRIVHVCQNTPNYMCKYIYSCIYTANDWPWALWKKQIIIKTI